MSHGLVLTTFGCLVTAALLEEFANIQAYALLSRRYRWMSDLYGNALAKIKLAMRDSSTAEQKSEVLSTILFELGKESLAENADWVVQHRQRPPILPSG